VSSAPAGADAAGKSGAVVMLLSLSATRRLMKTTEDPINSLGSSKAGGLGDDTAESCEQSARNREEEPSTASTDHAQYSS
jgi:hypothetical protein